MFQTVLLNCGMRYNYAGTHFLASSFSLPFRMIVSPNSGVCGRTIEYGRFAWAISRLLNASSETRWRGRSFTEQNNKNNTQRDEKHRDTECVCEWVEDSAITVDCELPVVVTMRVRANTREPHQPAAYCGVVWRRFSVAQVLWSVARYQSESRTTTRRRSIIGTGRASMISSKASTVVSTVVSIGPTNDVRNERIRNMELYTFLVRYM